MSALADLVDLDRYPIHELEGSAAQALVAECREGLRTEGAVRLDAFVRADAVDRMAEEAGDIATQGYPNDAAHNCYFDDEIDESLPEDHPRRIMVRSAQKAVAMDLLPERLRAAPDLRVGRGARLRRRRAGEGRALPERRPARRREHDGVRGRRRARLALRPERVLRDADDPALAGRWRLRVRADGAGAGRRALRRRARRARSARRRRSCSRRSRARSRSSAAGTRSIACLRSWARRRA